MVLVELKIWCSNRNNTRTTHYNEVQIHVFSPWYSSLYKIFVDKCFWWLFEYLVIYWKIKTQSIQWIYAPPEWNESKKVHWHSLTTARHFHRLTNTHADSSLMCGIIFATQFHLSELVLFRRFSWLSISIDDKC